MGIKMEIEWHRTIDKMHPEKPGKCRYEQILCFCLLKKNRSIKVLQWNCEHLVWDDESGDDFFCEASQVIAWALFPGFPIDKIESAAS
jgi:hypothetical protein